MHEGPPLSEGFGEYVVRLDKAKIMITGIKG